MRAIGSPLGSGAALDGCSATAGLRSGVIVILRVGPLGTVCGLEVVTRLSPAPQRTAVGAVRASQAAVIGRVTPATLSRKADSLASLAIDALRPRRRVLAVVS